MTAATVTPSPVPVTGPPVVALSSPTIAGTLGSVGQPLALVVLGSNAEGTLAMRTKNDRLVRFDILGVNGSPVEPSLVSTIAVQLRRSSDPPAAAVNITPVSDPTTVDGVEYGWSVDTEAVITTGGLWALEVDVVFTDLAHATWPHLGTQRIRASAGVST